jgi:hypothetical protein
MKNRSRQKETLALSERGRREAARYSLDAEYTRVHRQIIEQMHVADINALRSEDDVLQAGVRVANRAGTSTGQARSDAHHAVEPKPGGYRRPKARRRRHD